MTNWKQQGLLNASIPLYSDLCYAYINRFCYSVTAKQYVITNCKLQKRVKFSGKIPIIDVPLGSYKWLSNQGG